MTTKSKEYSTKSSVRILKLKELCRLRCMTYTDLNQSTGRSRTCFWDIHRKKSVDKEVVYDICATLKARAIFREGRLQGFVPQEDLDLPRP